MRIMSTMRYKLNEQRQPAAVTLRAPRAGDSVAFALNAAYDVDEELPDDFAAMLRELDKRSGPNA
ncbi:MAG: hypothetical protein A4S16_07010 [Proteobacteria bacterium SG_bin6]|nr:MAG: hypothetical protein A4S16_07010 [Proteobacteria bacterium SG_bin6]